MEFIYFLAAAFLIILGIFPFVKCFRQRLAEKRQLEAESEASELRVAKARLVSKHSEIKYTSGYKQPEHYVAYYAEFDTADGTEKYEIDEQTFSENEEGTIKDLVTENGKFFCFGKGEKIE